MEEKNKRDKSDKKHRSLIPPSVWIISEGIIILALIVVILMLLVKIQQLRNIPFSYDPEDKSITEVLDSVCAALPKEAEILARFNDKEHHAMLYVNNGSLYRFDIPTRSTHGVPLPKGGGTPWEIVSAALSPDDRYILITAIRSNLSTANALFRYNVLSGNTVKLAEGSSITPNEHGYEVEDRRRGLRLFDLYGEAVKIEEPVDEVDSMTMGGDEVKEQDIVPGQSVSAATTSVDESSATVRNVKE